MALPVIGVGGKLTSPVMIKTPRFLPLPTTLAPHYGLYGLGITKDHSKIRRSFWWDDYGADRYVWSEGQKRYVTHSTTSYGVGGQLYSTAYFDDGCFLLGSLTELMEFPWESTTGFIVATYSGGSHFPPWGESTLWLSAPMVVGGKRIVTQIFGYGPPYTLRIWGKVGDAYQYQDTPFDPTLTTDVSSARWVVDPSSSSNIITAVTNKTHRGDGKLDVWIRVYRINVSNATVNRCFEYLLVYETLPQGFSGDDITTLLGGGDLAVFHDNSLLYFKWNGNSYSPPSTSPGFPDATYFNWFEGLPSGGDLYFRRPLSLRILQPDSTYSSSSIPLTTIPPPDFGNIAALVDPVTKRLQRIVMAQQFGGQCYIAPYQVIY